jgi:hydrogenase maturation factor
MHTEMLLSRLQKLRLLVHDLDSGKLKTEIKYCRYVDKEGNFRYRQVLGTDYDLLARKRRDLHQLKLFLTANGVQY